MLLTDMVFPVKIPGLKWATALLGLYAVIWIPLEGNLSRVVLLSIWATAVSAGYLWQKYLGGRRLPLARGLTALAGAGLLMGLGSGILALVFMSLKSGLHAHGPEFRPDEINWVIRQIPLWMGAGLLAGLGLGLLLVASSDT